MMYFLAFVRFKKVHDVFCRYFEALCYNLRRMITVRQLFQKAKDFSKKQVICAMLAMVCACGAWGENTYYRWHSSSSGDWSTTTNWDGSNSGIGWDSPTNDTTLNSNGIYYVNTDTTSNSITIIVSADVTIRNLYIESDSAKSVKIILENNATLRMIGSMTFGNQSSNNDTVNFIVSGNGTIYANTLSYNNKSTNSKILIENGATLKSYSFGNNSSGSISITGDGTGTLDLQGANLDNVTGVNLDESKVSLNGNPLVSDKKYYWIGASSGDWTVSSNWSHKPNGSPLGSGYPGHADDETAVFSAAVEVNNLSLENGVENLTIENNSTGRVSIADCGTNSENAKITLTGTGEIILNACKFSSITVNENSNVLLMHSGGKTFSLEVENLTIAKDAKVYGNTGSILNVTTKLTVAGEIADGADYQKLSELSVTGTTDITSTGKITLSSATQTYAGEVKNNGEITLGNSVAYFNGGYSGTGALNVSTGTVTFGTGTTNTVSKLAVSSTGIVTNLSKNPVVLGEVTCGTAAATFYGDFAFSANAANAANGSFSCSTVYFNNGNVDFTNCETFSGTNVIVNFHNRDSSQKTLTLPNKNLPVKELYFGGNVKLLGNATTAVTAISKCQMMNLLGASVHNLEIDANLNCLDLFEQSAETKVTVKEGKTLRIRYDYRGYGGATSNKNEVVVEGTISVGNDFGGGEGNPAEVTVESTGKIIAAGIIGRANSSTERGKIAVLTNNGTIQTKSLYVEKLVSTGTENFTSPSGEITLTDADSNFKDVVIDSSANVTLNSDIKITGNVNNNGTLNANGKKLSLTGTNSNPSEITGTGEFVVSETNFTGEYLSIGDEIKICETAGSIVPKKFLASSSSPKSGVSLGDIFNNGWKLGGLIYKWTGGDSSAWSDALNWDVGLVPDATSIVTYATGIIANQPVLGGAVTIGHITITEGNSIDLNGENFEVTGSCDTLPSGSTFDISKAFVNKGTVYLTGKETVRLPNDSTKISEDGTWHYTGDDATCIVKQIAPGVDYKKLIICGTIKVSPIYRIKAADGIQLGTASDSVTIIGSAEFSSPVTLANDASVGVNDPSITVRFGDTVDGAKRLSLSGGRIFLHKDIGGRTPLASIECDAGSTLSVYGATVKTTGNQTYNGHVQLYGVSSDPVAVPAADTGGDVEFISSSGNIVFNDFVSGDGSSGAVNHGLTVTAPVGNVTFSKSVGEETAIPLSFVKVEANSISIKGNVKCNGIHTYDGTVSIAGDSALTSAVSKQIDFKSNVSIDTGKTLALGSSAADALSVTVAGNWSNSGTLTPNQSTVTFTGSSATISGNSAFYNAVFNGAGASLSGNNTFDGTASFNAATNLLGNNTFNNFTCEKGGITLAFDSGTKQTISGTPSALSVPLVLKGESSSSLLSLSGEGTIIVPQSTDTQKYLDAAYLSIGGNVVIKASASGDVKNGAYKAYSGTQKSSVPANPSSPDEQLAYAKLFKNGWDLGYEFFFTWTGGNTAWSTASNWDLELVPGLAAQNTSGARVLIPDGCSSYPRIYSAQIKLSELTVGTASNSSHDARVILSTSGYSGYLQVISASGTGTFVNYGTIEYKDSSRITNGTVPINDVANGGTVEYSGSAQTVTDFSSSIEDYANLVISGVNVAVAANAEIVVGGNLTVKSGGSLTTNSSSTSVPSVIFAGTSVTQELSVESAATAQFANVKINSGTSVRASGSYTVTGNWTNENSTAGFTATDGTISFTGTNVTVAGKNAFNNIEFTTAGSTITLSDTNTFNGTATFSGSGSTISLSDANTFSSLAFNAPGITAKFAAGKTQTVTGSLSSAGASGSEVLLTTDSASPSVDDESTWWILNMPNYNASSPAASFSSFVNTKVSYSKAEPIVAHYWDASVAEGDVDSTLYWFISDYYWLGSVDSVWGTAGNWAFKVNGSYVPARMAPTYAKGQNSVFVDTQAGGKDSILPADVKFKRLEVFAGKTIDLKGFKVTANDSDSATIDFVNNGKVRLYGVSGQIDSAHENGTDSTVEYYSEASGASSSFVWGNVYENLNVLGPFSVSEDVTVAKNLIFGKTDSFGASGTIANKFSVTGTTLIANGTGNSLSLGGANVFGSLLTFGNGTAPSAPAGDITLSGNNVFASGVSVVNGGNLVLKGTASSGGAFSVSQSAGGSCTSLEIQSSVVFASDFSSPLNFSGASSTIDGNGKTFGANVTFNGAESTLLGDNTFSADSSFNAATTISGSNSFNKAVFGENMSFGGSNTFAEFVCKSAGKTLDFAPGSNQTVTKLTVRGSSASKINLTGSGEWNITPQNIPEISVAHAVVTNSNNTATEPIIVYAKGGYNVDGTGNTGWIFAGQEYVWTGEDSSAPTEWNKIANWSPNSVPGRYSDVKILQVPGGNYPILSADLILDKGSKTFALDDDDDGIADRNEEVSSSVVIGSDVVFDFNGKNVSLNRLSNSGRIRLQGSEIIISDGNVGIANLPLDSNSFLTGLFEYYGNFGTALNFGTNFNHLEFTSGAKGSESRAVSVNERLLVTNGTGNAISLAGTNIFADGIKIVAAGQIELRGAKDSSGTAVSLFGSASGVIDCDSLKLHSPANFDSDIVLDIHSASFAGNVTGSGIIDFKGDFLSFGAVNVSARYVLASGAASRSLGAESGASLSFGCDAFVDIDSSAVLTVSSDLSWTKVLGLYSGKVSAGAVNLSGKDLLVFGAAYNADDPRYDGADTRFAYFGFDSLLYKGSSAPVWHSEFATSSTTVTLSGNLYVNGVNLDGCSFVLPNQDFANPLFNFSADVTEKQWGIPYAVVFNSTVSNCSASASAGTAFVTASKFQNITDTSSDSGNSGFQFNVPQIVEAYSVSDSVLCVKFDMALENSNSEVASTVALVSSLETGGIFYNDKAFAFDGKFYTEFDGENCSVPLAASSFAAGDIPALTPLYLKAASDENKWNTDATANSLGSDVSMDRSGIHRENKIDLSLFEGLFYASEGKTMCRNYGIGLWRSENSSEYSEAEIFASIDKARPVLVDVFAGQELHVNNSGVASSQKPYDSHNFIELRYSEPVDIGNLLSGAEANNQNQQAEDVFDSEQNHGGAISNNVSGDGILVTGFVSIEKGEITAGYKERGENGFVGVIDNVKPHSLYRKFALNAESPEEIHTNRIRVSVAGYVDEENPVSLENSSFNNWVGYIDSSTSPSGAVVPVANNFITDLAVDSEGNALKNIFDEKNSSRGIAVNDRADLSEVSLYGEWDSSHPVFAPYVTNFDDSEPALSWNNGDAADRQYEMLGTVDSNTNAFIDKIEMHLFDNGQTYDVSSPHKWIAQKGWFASESADVLEGFSAPESSGGSRGIPLSKAMTYGGIRRSSLVGASSAFTYSYKIDTTESDVRTFAEAEISQHVKSPLFRNKELSETFTNDDGLYLGISINPNDSRLPIRTVFTVTYSPAKSFITDLSGNRLIQTDVDSDKKILHTIDIMPPSFMLTVSPVGENKIYAVFTKPLAYKGTYLYEMGGELDSVLEGIRSNLEFVYSDDDDVDTNNIVGEENRISVTSAELVSKSKEYTAILFTLDRNISLSDVEKIWIRVNDEGEFMETFFGKIRASYIQDLYGNPAPAHTCHALSDFAVNAVNVLYAYADSSDGDNWSEEEIYGAGLAPESSDYAVHDFSGAEENYNRLRSGRDIVFQYEFIDSDNSGTKRGVQNGESLALVCDEKSNIRPEWKSDKFNLVTDGSWRIWFDSYLDSLVSSFNPSPLSANLSSPPIFADVHGSEILKNMTWLNSAFNIGAGKEYQFFFKLLDSTGNVIQINHDGDKTTKRIPLYAFRMPKERIAAGDFSFIDLWSFTTRDLTRQRGGVTILNNVINAAIGEKTAIEVNMKNDGNLNVFVMTLDGNIVKRLSKGTQKAGTHYFYWDGKNGAGNPVARGLYFVRVSGSGIDETRKVMVVK